MKDHEARVIDERVQLADKLGRLDAFIRNSPAFLGLDPFDQMLLRMQEREMRNYLGILDLRIARF